MTENEFESLREKFSQNPLYEKSSSLFKKYQMLQFLDENDVPLENRHKRIVSIKDKPTCVIFNFKNGLFHSENGLPAIEYLNHWEFWKNGFIEKVVDTKFKTEEFWANGVPLEIIKTE